MLLILLNSTLHNIVNTQHSVKHQNNKQVSLHNKKDVHKYNDITIRLSNSTFTLFKELINEALGLTLIYVATAGRAKPVKRSSFIDERSHVFRRRNNENVL